MEVAALNDQVPDLTHLPRKGGERADFAIAIDIRGGRRGQPGGQRLLAAQ